MLLVNLMLVFDMYNWLWFAAIFNAFALSIYWVVAPGMIADIYGVRNFGKNFGISLVIGGLTCGFLQTAGGWWYALTIDDGDIRCKSSECFRTVFSINLGLSSFAALFLSFLPPRVPESPKGTRLRGVVNVRYFDQRAEDMFMESRTRLHDLWVKGFEETTDKEESVEYADNVARLAYAKRMELLMGDFQSEHRQQLGDHEWEDEEIQYGSQYAEKYFKAEEIERLPGEKESDFQLGVLAAISKQPTHGEEGEEEREIGQTTELSVVDVTSFEQSRSSHSSTSSSLIFE